MVYRYLFNRWVDPLIGVSIGVAAYAVEEHKAHVPGNRLVDLVRRRWAN